MTTIAHVDVLIDGLSTLLGTNLNLTVCQTEPLTFADCTSKAVSNVVLLTVGEILLSDGVNIRSKKITVPSKILLNGITVEVTDIEADLWLAVFDGTRLLLKTDGIANRALPLEATVLTPVFDFGVQQA